MGDVTEFPGGVRPPPTGDVWDERTRPLDEAYALEILQKRLPAEALRNVAGLDLASIARAVVLEIDTVRHARRFDPRYDERRACGEFKALEEMFAGPPRTYDTEPPTPA